MPVENIKIGWECGVEGGISETKITINAMIRDRKFEVKCSLILVTFIVKINGEKFGVYNSPQNDEFFKENCFHFIEVFLKKKLESEIADRQNILILI